MGWECFWTSNQKIQGQMCWINDFKTGGRRVPDFDLFRVQADIVKKFRFSRVRTPRRYPGFDIPFNHPLTTSNNLNLNDIVTNNNYPPPTTMMTPFVLLLFFGWVPHPFVWISPLILGNLPPWMFPHHWMTPRLYTVISISIIMNTNPNSQTLKKTPLWPIRTEHHSQIRNI